MFSISRIPLMHCTFDKFCVEQYRYPYPNTDTKNGVVISQLIFPENAAYFVAQ